MASEIKAGRWAAQVEGDFVVFLIGTKVDLRHPVRWFRDVGGTRGMLHMLSVLEKEPERGLLGYQGKGLLIVQYWRSFDHLERFAREAPHEPALRRYYKRTNGQARSGIWHETFLVRDGEYEAIYGNMPPHGLGRATTLVPLSEQSTARGRLRRRAGSRT